MRNNIKANLTSSFVFFWEFLLFNLLIIFIFFLLLKITFAITFSLILLFTSFLFLNLIGKKRRRELDEIKQIMKNIRKNYYTSSEEIVLSNNLRGLEKEIKKMFAKAKNDIEFLQRLQKVRSQFLANVSHELRTPIFAIQGYLETLMDGAIEDKNVNRNFLEKANQHTLNLNNLLNDLIDISMVESGEMRMSYRYFDLKDYLDPIINELKSEAAKKELELVCQPVREGLQVFGDKSKLRQVFVNLIQNAIKYTETGSIKIEVNEDKKFVRISITDSGIGIPEEEIDRIFERFYRIDKTRSRSVGGTGLGLAIVKHIVEAHGSKIEVTSRLGEGSSFTFSLKK